jgi:hypothetical protein
MHIIGRIPTDGLGLCLLEITWGGSSTRRLYPVIGPNLIFEEKLRLLLL